MATANRRASGSGSIWIWLALFALPFAGVGVGSGVWLARDIVEYRRTQGWEETPAKILSVDWKCIRSGSKGNEYKAEVAYQYRYRDRSYTGHRLSLDEVSGSFQENSLPELRRYRARGMPFHCYVNPEQPAEATLYRDLPWHTFAFQAGFALAFGGAGFGLLAFALFGRRSQRTKGALAQAHPEEPWLWRKDWADGSIRGLATSLVGPLLFAVFWNGFCAVAWFAFLCNRTGRSDEQVFLWFMIPFTAIGMGLLGLAAVSVMRWRKFGRSVFQMASVPGVIGGQLAGVIRTPVKIEPQDAFRLRLTCVDLVSSRNSRNTSRNLVWQDEQRIAHDMLQGDVSHSAIPVLFQIPYECRPTDDSDPNHTISWTLEAAAKTSGLDYSAQFDVPVFKTPESDPHFVVDRELVAKYAAPDDPERDLRDARVIKTPSPSGDGWQFVFPMARSPGGAILCTLGSLIFFGAPAVWLYRDFQFIAIPFAIVFGLFGTIFLFLALDAWFYRSVVDVSHRGLTVTGGLFGRGSRRWIEASAVAKIDTVSNMSNDRLMYYDLIIVCRDGKRVTAGKRLPGHRLAVAVLQQIEQAMGKQQASVGS